MTEVAELYFLVRFTASLISVEARVDYFNITLLYRGTRDRPEKCSDKDGTNTNQSTIRALTNSTAILPANAQTSLTILLSIIDRHYYEFLESNRTLINK